MPQEAFPAYPVRLSRPWGELSARQAGGGAPVMLLHAEGRSGADWDAYAEALARSRRVVVPDFFGHGRSTVPVGVVRLQNAVEDVLALADHLWLGRIDWVGHGFGGAVALEVLRRFPQRVGKVIVFDGWPSAKYLHALGDSLTAGLAPETEERVAREVRQTFSLWPSSIREIFWSTVERFDAGELLRGTSADVLFVYGTRAGNRADATATPERLGLPRRGNIRTEWVGGGHFFLLTHVEETRRLLLRELSPEAGRNAADDGNEEPPSPIDLKNLYLRRR